MINRTLEYILIKGFDVLFLLSGFFLFIASIYSFLIKDWSMGITLFFGGIVIIYMGYKNIKLSYCKGQIDPRIIWVLIALAILYLLIKTYIWR